MIKVIKNNKIFFFSITALSVTGIVLAIISQDIGSSSQEYEWTGIGVCGFSFVCWIIFGKKINNEIKKIKNQMKRAKAERVKKRIEELKRVNAARKIQNWFRKTYDQSKLFQSYQISHHEDSAKTFPVRILQITDVGQLRGVYKKIEAWRVHTWSRSIALMQSSWASEKERDVVSNRLAIIDNILMLNDDDSYEEILNKYRITVSMDDRNSLHGVCFSTFRKSGSEVHIDYLLSAPGPLKEIGASLIAENIFFSIKRRKDLSSSASSDKLPIERTTVSLVPLDRTNSLKENYYMNILHFKERRRMITYYDQRMKKEMQREMTDLILQGQDLRYLLRRSGGRYLPQSTGTADLRAQ